MGGIIKVHLSLEFPWKHSKQIQRSSYYSRSRSEVKGQFQKNEVSESNMFEAKTLVYENVVCIVPMDGSIYASCQRTLVGETQDYCLGNNIIKCPQINYILYLQNHRQFTSTVTLSQAVCFLSFNSDRL